MNVSPFHPHPEQEFLLAAALHPGVKAVAAWEQWRARVDFEKDHLEGGSFHLLPLVYHNLQRAGWDDPLLDRLKGIYRRAWFANRLALRPLAGLTALLQEADIPALLVGAAALGQSVYPEMGLRPIDALRLVVPHEQVDLAVDALLTAGWQPQPASQPWREAVRSPWLTGMRFSTRGGESFLLEWHSLALWPSPAIDRPFFLRAVPLTIGEVVVNILEPTDQLLRVCADLEQGFLVGLADAAHLLRAGGIEWERFAQMAADCQVSALAAACLRALEMVVPLPPPAPVVERLEQIAATPFEKYLLNSLSAPSALCAPQRLRGEWQRFRRLALLQSLAPTVGHFLNYLQLRRGVASRRELFTHLLSRSVKNL